MKDETGDTVTVGTSYNDKQVSMFTESEDMYYTPEKARKLAKKLRKAADKVDGGKAKVAGKPFKWETALLAIPAPPANVTLALTVAEAETLAVVLAHCCGPTKFSYDASTTGRTSPMEQVLDVVKRLESLGFDYETLADGQNARFATDPRTPASVEFIGYPKVAA